MSSIRLHAFEWGALDVLALVLRLACLPVLVSTIELLAARATFGDDTLMSWELSKLRHPRFVVGWTGRLLHALMNHSTFVGLLCLRGLLSAVLLVHPNAWILNPVVVFTMSGLLTLSSLRSIYGQDGADQMQLIIWAAALIATATGGEEVAVLCVWFIAFQTCMSYTIAGFAKVRAAGWRQGTFLPGVLGTTIYGTSSVGSFLRHHGRVAFVGSWMVLLFEMSFPLAWILPWPWGLSYLALGFAFHVANAFVMGLGSFLMTFAATYPAVWFTLERKGW